MTGKLSDETCKLNELWQLFDDPNLSSRFEYCMLYNISYSNNSIICAHYVAYTLFRNPDALMHFPTILYICSAVKIAQPLTKVNKLQQARNFIKMRLVISLHQYILENKFIYLFTTI